MFVVDTLPAHAARDAAEGGGGKEEEKREEEVAALSPTALYQSLRQMLRASNLNNVRIGGELTNLSVRSGTYYFAVKDESNRVDCVVWSSRVEHVLRRPKDVRDGAQVVVRGGISPYGRWSKVQCYVEQLHVGSGEGEWEAQLREWREDLAKRGIFDAGRKRCVPEIIQNLAIVTSAAGAALQDVLQILREHGAAMSVRIFPCLVQGRDCVRSVLQQFNLIDALVAEGCYRPDAVLLTRGGGSREDLFEFHRPEICEAVRRASVPVVTALGHQVDTHLCDLAADVSCITPSAAAQRFGGAYRQLRDALARDTLREHLRSALVRRDERTRALWREVCAENVAAACRQQVQAAGHRAHAALSRALLQRTQRWDALHCELVQSPLHGWTTAGNMAILRTLDGAADVDPSALCRGSAGALRMLVPGASAMRSICISYTVLDDDEH